MQVRYHKDRDRGRRNKGQKLIFQASRMQNQVCRGERITQVIQMHIIIIRRERERKKKKSDT